MNMAVTYGKICAVLLAGMYFLYGAHHPHMFWLIDGVNLLLHESGHVLFGLVGNEFLAFLGGTLMQLLIPLLFFIYYLRRFDVYSGAIMLMWCGENCFHIAPYIKDARTQLLPLVGGGQHDWAYILGHLHLLPYDHYIGSWVWTCGIILVICGIGIVFFPLRRACADT